MLVLAKWLFPLVPISFCLGAITAGLAGNLVYRATVIPLFYFIYFVIVTYPFAALFPYAVIDDESNAYSPSNATSPLYEEPIVRGMASRNNEDADSHLLKAKRIMMSKLSSGYNLLILSFLLSLIEWGATFIDVRVSFALGNSLFIIIGLFLLPLLFFLYGYDRVAVRPRHQSLIGYVAVICVIWNLFIVWLTFLDSKNSLFYRSLNFASIPPQLYVVFYLDRNRNLSYNYFYMFLYSTALVKMPDFFGHLVVRYMDNVEVYASTKAPEWISEVKISLSIFFIVAMLIYMQLLDTVSKRMTTSRAFPRFLFIGQLYYYFFWYQMLGNFKPLDRQYWFMLVFLNINYILTNSGILSDIQTSVMQCCKVMSYQQVETHDHQGDTRTDALATLIYRIKVAEQDYLADFTSLVAVPIITSFKGVIIPKLGDNEDGESLSVWNLTLRCTFFLAGRFLTSKTLQRLFGHQLHRFKVDKDDNTMANSDDEDYLENGNVNQSDFEGFLSPVKMSSSPSTDKRLSSGVKKRESRKLSSIIMPHLPQSARAQFEALYSTTEEDFQNCFWYYCCVVVAIAFACFQEKDLPSRFAFYSSGTKT